MSHCHCEEPAIVSMAGDVAISLYKSEIASSQCLLSQGSTGARNDVKGRSTKTGESPEANLINDQKDLSRGGPRLNYKAGVTLVELIMAMVILGFVALASAAMIGAQIQGMVTSTDFTAAGNLARLEIEKLNNIPYASVANGSSVSGSYTVTWTVATVAGGGGAERKDITLTAKRTGTAADLVTLYSSLAKDVTYGP